MSKQVETGLVNKIFTLLDRKEGQNCIRNLLLQNRAEIGLTTEELEKLDLNHLSDKIKRSIESKESELDTETESETESESESDPDSKSETEWHWQCSCINQKYYEMHETCICGKWCCMCNEDWLQSKTCQMCIICGIKKPVFKK
jgi:hypothetical protein